MWKMVVVVSPGVAEFGSGLTKSRPQGRKQRESRTLRRSTEDCVSHSDLWHQLGGGEYGNTKDFVLVKIGVQSSTKSSGATRRVLV